MTHHDMQREKLIEEHIEECKYRISVINNFMATNKDADEDNCCKNILRLKTAISAMQELQQYRQTGTPEECRKAREKQTPAEIFTHTNDSDVKIGNITFRKGTKAHKCQCGRLVMRGYKYCPECGQAIGWR